MPTDGHWLGGVVQRVGDAEAAAKAALRVVNGFILSSPLLMGSAGVGMTALTLC